jgi:glycosyltransferase involved in cell wall biosynthesis
LSEVAHSPGIQFAKGLEAASDPGRGPIKVVHVITDLDSGGAERMITQLVSQGSADIEHVVVSLMDEGTFGEAIRAANVRLYCLNMLRGSLSPAALPRLLKILRQEKPDVLQTWLYHADLIGAMSALVRFGRTGWRLVWNIRCSAMEPRYNPPLTNLVLRILALLSRFPEAVIVNSRGGRKDHAAVGYRPRRWIYIPNGFDTERFRPDRAARTRLRKALGLAEDAMIVGMVARLDPMKDHRGFLHAVGIVQRQHPNVYFVLVGKGVERDAEIFTAALQAMPCPERVVCLGQRTEIDQLMPAFDALVLSSAYGEGFPNVLGEAMACGVPCITTDVGDAARIVGDSGIVVRPGDPDALADAIGRFLSMSGAERQSRAESARARIVSQYSIPKISDDYGSFYRGLVRQQADGKRRRQA